jgi:hypothetical protein
MSQPNFPDTIGTHLDDIWRRLRALETAPQANNTTVSGGSFTVLDVTGAERVRLGTLADGTIGIEVKDSGSVTVFKVNGVGLSYPELGLPTRMPNTAAPAVTSATFTTVWEAPIAWAASDSIYWAGVITTDAATSGEARLFAPNVPGAPTTSAYPLVTGGQTQPVFKWTVPGLVYGTGSVLIQLQVRRTAGAGNVNAFTPDSVYMANSGVIGATVTPGY